MRQHQSIQISKKESELIQFLDKNSSRWWEAYFQYEHRRSRKLRIYAPRKHRTQYQKKKERRLQHIFEANRRNRAHIKKKSLLRFFQKRFSNLTRRFNLKNNLDPTRLKSSTVMTSSSWFNSTLKKLHAKGIYTEIDYIKKRFNEEKELIEFFWTHPLDKSDHQVSKAV